MRESVKRRVRNTLSRRGLTHLVPGLVEDTVPASAPDQIAFLRLDTDYYSSTKVEFETMFPRLSPGSVMIVDDYGYYFHRVDACARLMIKPGLAA